MSTMGERLTGGNICHGCGRLILVGASHVCSNDQRYEPAPPAPAPPPPAPTTVVLPLVDERMLARLDRIVELLERLVGVSAPQAHREGCDCLICEPLTDAEIETDEP